MSIWNDIGPTAWGDDPLGKQFEGDRSEALRRIAASHTAARRRARAHATAWQLVFAYVHNERVLFACYDETQAEALIERAIEISGGAVTAEALRPFVHWAGKERLAGAATNYVDVDPDNLDDWVTAATHRLVAIDDVAPPATVDGEREEPS